MPRTPYQPAKAFLPNCRTLREDGAMSITQLAAAAGVDRGLVTSLEQGKAHTVPKVRAVFNALQRAAGTELDPRVEIVPQRFLPNCRTLREDCKLTVTALAEQAGVGREVVEGFERQHGGTLAQAEAILAVLADCLQRRHRTLDPAREIAQGPR